VNWSAVVEEIRRSVPDLQAVYLFGSVASGEQRPGSDVDLALLAPRRLDSVQRFRLQERLAAILGRDVDLVDMRSASTVMQVQVLGGSQLLFEGETTARALFEATALGAYVRLNVSRAGILNDIKARGTVHG